MVMQNFQIIYPLKNTDIESILNIYNRFSVRIIQQEHELFYVEKREVENENVCVRLDAWVQKKYRLKNKSHHFLRLDKWSWIKSHRPQSPRTIITMLEKSEDLVGGHMLLTDKHYDLPRLTKDHEIIGDSMHRSTVVPSTPKLDIGASLSYTPEALPAMSQVEQGHQIVLVSQYVKNS